MAFVTLLKGINVGGNNLVKMQDLRSHLTRRGLTAVQTYIQSGNIICNGPDATTVQAVIDDTLRQEFDIKCDSTCLPHDALSQAVADQPFDQPDSKLLHLYFPCAEAFANAPHLQGMAQDGETVVWQNDVLYLHTPGGYSKSRLAAKLPRLLSAPFTARNLNTATKLADIAGALALSDL